MSNRNLLEEIEARLEYVPRWNRIVGGLLLLPPFTVLGIVLLGRELLNAGEKLREAGDRADA